jgi:hypothetical protein
LTIGRQTLTDRQALEYLCNALNFLDNLGPTVAVQWLDRAQKLGLLRHSFIIHGYDELGRQTLFTEEELSVQHPLLASDNGNVVLDVHTKGTELAGNMLYSML